jgi:HEAT repeat protein
MLGQLGGDAAAERLIALLAEERYRFEYENAIEALGETGSPKAVPHLIKYLKSHPDSGAARNALVKIGEPAISDLSRLLSRGSWPLRIAAAQALAELDWQPRTPRQKILFTISRTEEAGPAAQSLNEDAIDFLIDALEEESLRSYALKMLGQIGDPRAMEALLPLLSDPGSAEYAAAIGVLEKLASPETVPVLIRALEHQPPHSPIGDILSRMGKAALPALVEQFEDGTLPIQYTAIEVLGKAGDRSAIPILKKVLRTGPWPLRFAAAPALASLDWTPMSFKEKALFALCQQQWDRVQDLGQIAVDPLIHLLQDDSMRHDDLLRIKAIEALGEIGDAQALDVLLDYLDLKHVYRDVRMAAAKTLIRLYQQGNLSQAQKKRILQNKAAIIKADHRDTAVHSDDVDWCTNDHTDYSRHMDVTSGLEFPR